MSETQTKQKMGLPKSMRGCKWRPTGLMSHSKQGSLPQEINNLKEKLDHIESENETLIKENKNMKKELSDVQITVIQKEIKLVNLQKEVDYMRDELKKLDTIVSTDLKENTDVPEKIDEPETKKIHDSKTEIRHDIEPESFLIVSEKKENKPMNSDSVFGSHGMELTTNESNVDIPVSIDISLLEHANHIQNETNRSQCTDSRNCGMTNTRVPDAPETTDTHKAQEMSRQNPKGHPHPTYTNVQELERLKFEKLLQQQKEKNAQLLSKILQLQGNIQVCCRIRPMTSNEINAGLNKILEPLGESEVGCFDAKSNAWKSFTFDKVWGPDKGQSQVYGDVEPLALSVVDGYNCCIFAYGQTGSGKTYSMEGNIDNNEHGISYRIIQKIIDLLKARKKKHNDRQYSFSIEVSMLEIYNDNIYDLLTSQKPRTNTGTNRTKSTTLYIRRDENNMLEVVNLTKQKVCSVQDILDLLSKGNSNRATAATNLNEHSSRSHMILNIKVTAGFLDKNQCIGNLFLVDLAGSERVRKSGVEGSTMKEAQHINKSLSALGNVMEALDRKASHIPYRNSKLTHLLSDALGGNSKTMMLLNVCPAANSFEETSAALQFATRARRIELGVAQQNVKFKNLEVTVKKLKQENRILAQSKKATDEQCNELKRALIRTREKMTMLKEEKKNATVKPKTLIGSGRYEAAIRKDDTRNRNSKSFVTQQQERSKHENNVRKHGKDDNDNDSNDNNTSVLRKKASRFADESPSKCSPPHPRSLQRSRKPVPHRKIAPCYPKPCPTRDEQNITRDEVAETRRQIIALLKKHYPKKVTKIDLLLEKTEGNEEALLEQLKILSQKKLREKRKDPVRKQNSAGEASGRNKPSVLIRSEMALERHKRRMESNTKSSKH